MLIHRSLTLLIVITQMTYVWNEGAGTPYCVASLER